MQSRFYFLQDVQGCKKVDCSKLQKKEESIFYNKQSCSNIIAPTETSHTKGETSVLFQCALLCFCE